MNTHELQKLQKLQKLLQKLSCCTYCKNTQKARCKRALFFAVGAFSVVAAAETFSRRTIGVRVLCQ